VGEGQDLSPFLLPPGHDAAVTVPLFFRLGSEFMPPLYEEALFYMPSTMLGISIAEAQRTLQLTDRLIKGVPRSAPRAGQSRPRRIGTALDAGDSDHTQTLRTASCRHWFELHPVLAVQQ